MTGDGRRQIEGTESADAEELGIGDIAVEGLSADEAFAVLANETRVRILQALGGADGAMSFTELRQAVGLRQGGRFNYHLDKLVGHFVGKNDDGYTLRKAGRRVVEAVLSGAVTDDAVIEPVEIDFDCRLCGAPVELGFGHERVELYCTECPGHYERSEKPRESIADGDRGVLGGFNLPAAGVRGRTAAEVLRAASLWGHLEALSAAKGVCPRCSGVVERSVRVCDDHDVGEDLCPACDRRHAVQVRSRCRNCIYELDGMAVNQLVASADLRSFVADQGIDPLADGVEWGWEYDEEVLATDPLSVRFTFTVEGESITLTVDEELAVVDVTRTG